ncbi:hypothetical protein [Halomarina pelagica]|uniref:hypothetical protein n=1 Tax=Halomarina pelagica TaxID=2961599 RepID=UPI0020C30B7A|nr:hypothetical protein [Halomarina sp. BND7]
MIPVEFSSRDAASTIRTNPKFRGFLADADDARTTTVLLKETTPAPAVSEIEGEAADSRAYRADQYGQVDLTAEERKRIDFTRTNVPTARSAKAIAQGKGVDDWLAYFDPELTVDEHRDVFERAVREDRGDYGGRERLDEREVDRRLAHGHQERQASERTRAKDFAFGGDREAQAFLRDEGPLGDVFDIGFERTAGGLSGYGEDFERLEDVHEGRSLRARTLDEMNDAPRTRDPFQWSNSPERWDYPGIDTVQPERLHAARSRRARTLDENEFAPVADTKEQWAHDPDRLDWPGIDTPRSYGATMDTPIPESDRGVPGSRDRHPGAGLVPDRVLDEQLEGTGLAPEDFVPGLGLEREEDVEERVRSRGTLFGLAPDDEIDLADVDPRARSDPLGELVDDRDRQGALTGFGLEADATQYRESRLEVEAASEFGIDDRTSSSFGVGRDEWSSEQDTLFGPEVNRKEKGLFDF